MKKLSIAIVLMAAGFTFADAQTTEAKEAAKQNVKVETVQQAEIQTADSAILMAPQAEVKAVEAEKSEATKEKSDQQKARKEKKEPKKAEAVKIE